MNGQKSMTDSKSQKQKLCKKQVCLGISAAMKKKIFSKKISPVWSSHVKILKSR